MNHNRALAALSAADTDISFTVEMITPENAQDYLDANDATAPDPKAIETYAAAMKADAWVMNGMPIIFDTDGALIDGVQRLSACVSALKPIRTLVARNVRRDTLHTIDQHRRRAYPSVLEARGVRNAPAVAGLMGRLIRYDNGIYGVPERGGLSWLLQDRVLEANPEIHEAIDISNLFKGSPVVAQARHMVVFMALQAGHIDAMRRFLAEIDDETVTTMSAATVLSTQLEARRDDPRMDVERIAAITILAFNDYLAGKHRRAYLWEPGDDDITGDIDPEDLAPDMVTSVPKVRRYDRARINRYHDWNLNVPHMSEYSGLRNAKIQTSDATDTFTGKTARDLQRAAVDPAGNVYAKVTMVTPEDAQGFLNRFNKENRKIQETHVRTIARDIEAGNWAFNAQPICFTANPFADDAAYPTVRLLNGQHRLEACVRADTPIQVPIAVGIDARAFATYDTQAKKSVKTGNAKGVDERVLNSAGIIQWRIDTGLRFNDRARPSSTELIEAVERHTGMAQHISLARRLKPFGSAGILTFFIYHIRNDNPALAEDFLHQLETGEEIEKGNPIRELRDTLLALRPQEAPASKGGKRTSASRAKVLGTLMDGWEQYKIFKLDRA